MADSEPTTAGANAGTPDPVFVDPNTDDLDQFSKLMSGTAQVKEEDTGTDTSEEVEAEDNAEATEDNNENEETEGDGETEEVDEPEPKPKPKSNRFQERIDELTARAREAERREAEANRRYEESQKTKAPTAQVEDNSNKAPSHVDKNEDGSDKYPLGEFDPDYIRDLTRHTIQVEHEAAKQADAKERAEQADKEAREALNVQWKEKLNTATTQYTDFLDKTLELESAFEGLDANYSDYLVQTIKSLDHGPEVLYHFANNLDEARKFVKMGALPATLKLGELNAHFANKNTQPTKQKVSTAPTPPPTNKGATKARTTVAGDTDNLDDFSKEFFKKRR